LGGLLGGLRRYLVRKFGRSFVGGVGLLGDAEGCLREGLAVLRSE